jgi:hypothetical protein
MFVEEDSMSEKPKFDALQAVHAVHALSAAGDEKKSKALLADWRGFLKANFSLTDDQVKWLATVDKGHEAEVKKILRQTVESKGKSRLVVVLVADHTKPGGLVHELRHESVEEQRQGLHEVRANFVIAHCDANCRNWGWGPA